MVFSNHIQTYLPIVFWNIVGIIIVFAFELWFLHGRQPVNLKIQVSFFTVCIVYYIFTCYVVLPFLYKKYRTSIWAFAWIICLLLAYTGLYALVNTALYSMLLKKWVFHVTVDDLKASLDRSSTVFIIAFGVWLFLEWRKHRKTSKLFEQQKKEAEERYLAMQNLFLRSQMRSHMLFNSLISIHMKVLDAAPEAPEAMELLTDLLDYDLRSGEEGILMSIANDLEVIDKFISLQQVLSKEKLQLVYKKDVDDDSVQVAPLLMQGFIENMFKHGSLFDAVEPALIQVSLKNRELHFHCKNKTRDTKSPLERGMGIRNATQRLINLYPEQYHLSTRSENGIFEVDLIVIL